MDGDYARFPSSAEVQQVLLLALMLYEERRVTDAVRARLPGKPELPDVILDDWRDRGLSETDIRRAIGLAAHAKEWFKDIAKGEQLGEIVAAALPSIPKTDLAKTLKRVADWIYAQ
jgi:hypothetical protein